MGDWGAQTKLRIMDVLVRYSLKRQMYNPAKLYCVDHALAAAMAFKFSADSGRILENIVFCELKRRGCDVYYWKDKSGKEVDFLIRQGQEITTALQVCQDIDAGETRKREISGALAAAVASAPGVNGADIFADDTDLYPK